MRNWNSVDSSPSSAVEIKEIFPIIMQVPFAGSFRIMYASAAPIGIDTRVARRHTYQKSSRHQDVFSFLPFALPIFLLRASILRNRFGDMFRLLMSETRVYIYTLLVACRVFSFAEAQVNSDSYYLKRKYLYTRRNKRTNNRNRHRYINQGTRRWIYRVTTTTFRHRKWASLSGKFLLARDNNISADSYCCCRSFEWRPGCWCWWGRRGASALNLEPNRCGKTVHLSTHRTCSEKQCNQTRLDVVQSLPAIQFLS